MEDLKSDLRTLRDRISDQGTIIETEEATKTALVLPFLAALGYEVFDPKEVVPEFTADAVGKKGEKVDYAISFEGEIQILIECKALGVKLEKRHLSQLFRYFAVTGAKFAVLTNGCEYRFYTDLDKKNILDAKPFFTLDILDNSTGQISELQKFEKSSFNIDSILQDAERLKYVSAAKTYLRSQMESPSEEFIRIVAGEVVDGRLTATKRMQVGSVIKNAFGELVRDAVQDRLSSALATTNSSEPVHIESSAVSEVETTEDELAATMIIKSIVREIIDVTRVGLRDSKSYCAVLVDDNNRKPLARLFFNGNQKYIGIFDGSDFNKVAIASLDEIFGMKAELAIAAGIYRE